MYDFLEDNCLRTMTKADNRQILPQGNYWRQIPSLDDLRKIPLINMQLSDTYATSEKIRDKARAIMLASAIAQPRSYCNFAKEAELIVRGGPSCWSIWRVDFYVYMLRLHCVDRNALEKYYIHGGSYPNSIGHFRACSYVDIISPSSLGLQFTMPDIWPGTAWRIDCTMNSSSPDGTHSIILKEHIGEELTGEISQNVSTLVSPRATAAIAAKAAKAAKATNANNTTDVEGRPLEAVNAAELANHPD